jgi:hypothetical protein
VTPATGRLAFVSIESQIACADVAALADQRVRRAATRPAQALALQARGSCQLGQLLSPRNTHGGVTPTCAKSASLSRSVAERRDHWSWPPAQAGTRTASPLDTGVPHPADSELVIQARASPRRPARRSSTAAGPAGWSSGAPAARTATPTSSAATA